MDNGPPFTLQQRGPRLLVTHPLSYFKPFPTQWGSGRDGPRLQTNKKCSGGIAGCRLFSPPGKSPATAVRRMAVSTSEIGCILTLRRKLLT